MSFSGDYLPNKLLVGFLCEWAGKAVSLNEKCTNVAKNTKTLDILKRMGKGEEISGKELKHMTSLAFGNCSGEKYKSKEWNTHQAVAWTIALGYLASHIQLKCIEAGVKKEDMDSILANMLKGKK